MRGEMNGPEGPPFFHRNRIFKIAEIVNETRVEVVLTGFRLKVKQGKSAEGGPLLDLMVKLGGSVEANLPVLESLVGSVPRSKDLFTKYP